MSKSEGAMVRQAIDGPQIEEREFLEFAYERNKEDAKRASSAAESRQKIGEYLDDVNLHPKALGVGRTILKMVDKGDDGQAKAMDFIRGLKAVLKIVEPEVSGQQSEMDLDVDSEAVAAPVLTVVGGYDSSGDADIDQEAAAFEAGLAQVAAQ
jgi:hypothetical protein